MTSFKAQQQLIKKFVVAVRVAGNGSTKYACQYCSRLRLHEHVYLGEVCQRGLGQCLIVIGYGVRSWLHAGHVYLHMSLRHGVITVTIIHQGRPTPGNVS